MALSEFEKNELRNAIGLFVRELSETLPDKSFNKNHIHFDSKYYQMGTLIWAALANTDSAKLKYYTKNSSQRALLKQLFKLHNDGIVAVTAGGHRYIHPTPAYRLEMYRLLIEEMNLVCPDRTHYHPFLEDTSHLVGMEKIRDLFVQYTTKTQPGSLERYYLGYSILLEKEALGLPSELTSEQNIFSSDCGSAPGDFSHLDLSYLNLTPIAHIKNGGGFAQLNFQNSNLTGTSFNGIDLRWADFSGAELKFADLSEPYLDIIHRSYYQYLCFEWNDARIGLKNANVASAYIDDRFVKAEHAKNAAEAYYSNAEKLGKNAYSESYANHIKQLKEKAAINLFDEKILKGTIDSDQKIRKIQAYVYKLLEELNDSVPNLASIIFRIMDNGIHVIDQIDNRDAFSELVKMINALPDKLNFDCSDLEKNTWILAAMLEWLWLKHSDEKHPLSLDTYEIAKLGNGKAKLKQIIIDEAAQAKAIKAAKEIALQRIESQRNLISQLQILVQCDFSNLTFVGDRPKGINKIKSILEAHPIYVAAKNTKVYGKFEFNNKLVKVIDMQAYEATQNDPDPVLSTSTEMKQILTSIIVAATSKHSTSTCSFFYNKLRGRDKDIERLYQTLAKLDVDDVTSVKNATNEVKLLIGKIGGLQQVPINIKSANKLIDVDDSPKVKTIF